MKESLIQQLRIIAIYLLIGLPVLWIANRVWKGFSKKSIVEKQQPFKHVKLDQKISGNWKFNILDTQGWIDADLDDSQWEEIAVPSSWEQQGFENYNGYAWYRKKIVLNPELKGSYLDLYLGRIDDVDEVYANGELVGKSGQFPPDFATSYNSYRLYHIPPQLTETGVVQLAIRIFDSEFEGGIIEGPIGLKRRESQQYVDVPLEGIWRFRKSYEQEVKIPADSMPWTDIYVPSFWEGNGLRDFDGFAWYKREFELSEEEAAQQWVAVLGKIDDLDKTYINGQMIGSTGSPEAWQGEVDGEEYRKDRGYFIPEGVLKSGKNVIAVRVLDVTADGGIYEGPVGLILQSNYTSFWKSRKQVKKQTMLYGHEKPKKKHLWSLY